MSSRRLHPVCRVLRTAREVIESAVLFLVSLALAVILIAHLYRFVASAVDAAAKNIPAVSSKPNEQKDDACVYPPYEEKTFAFDTVTQALAINQLHLTPVGGNAIKAQQWPYWLVAPENEVEFSILDAVARENYPITECWTRRERMFR